MRGRREAAQEAVLLFRIQLLTMDFGKHQLISPARRRLGFECALTESEYITQLNHTTKVLVAALALCWGPTLLYDCTPTPSNFTGLH